MPTKNKRRDTTRGSLFLILALGGLLSACSQPDRAEVSAAERLARHFSVTQQVLTNFQGVDAALRADCKRAGAICSTYRMSLVNRRYADSSAVPPPRSNNWRTRIIPQPLKTKVTG